MSDASIDKSSGGAPRLQLVARRQTGSALFEPIPLKPGVMYVGRTPTNDVQLPSELVSRRHAKLIYTDMGLTVHDLDSHNGVFLNGKKVRSTPVAVGDLLYFADVCCQVAQSDVAFDDAFAVESSLNKSDLVSQALRGGGSQDPAVRNLSALIQATDLLLTADDESFLPEIVQRCRDLTEATYGVYVRRTVDGSLETPVILREGTAPRGEAPVSWAVVRKCIDEGAVLFSRDASADPLVPGDLLAAGDAGAVMCVPVVTAGAAVGAIYLGRPFAGEGFTDREVETISAMAHLIALRHDRGRPSMAAEPESDERTAIKDQVRTAEEAETHAALVREADALRERVAVLERQLQENEIVGNETALTLQSLRADHETMRQRLAEQGEGAGALEARERDALARLGEAERRVAELEARLEAQTTELAAARNDSAAVNEEAARLRREVLTLGDENSHAAAEVARLAAELEGVRTQLGAAEARGAAAAEALADAKKDAIDLEQLEIATEALSPRVARRVLRIATGEAPGDELGAGLLTVLCLSISGLDSWVGTVGTDEARRRVDLFCEGVQVAAADHGGTVEQIMGHSHLISFPGDGAGVRGALACGREVLARVPPDASGGVQGGVHLAPAVLGFFGGGVQAVYAQFGEAVAIARAASEYARPGSVFVSEAVRSVVGDDPSLVFISAGPHLIRGFMVPVALFQLGPPPVA